MATYMHVIIHSGDMSHMQQHAGTGMLHMRDLHAPQATAHAGLQAQTMALQSHPLCSKPHENGKQTGVLMHKGCQQAMLLKCC